MASGRADLPTLRALRLGEKSLFQSGHNPCDAVLDRYRAGTEYAGVWTHWVGGPEEELCRRQNSLNQTVEFFASAWLASIRTNGWRCFAARRSV